MNILWIGGVFSDRALKQYRAVNQAQNRWSLGLIRALRGYGWRFSSLAFRAEQLWPKGSLFPGKSSDFHPDVDPILVKVINLPVVRSMTLSHLYLFTLKKYLVDHSPPGLIISYNPLPWHVPAASWLKRTHGVPWVSITLDMKFPGENMETFEKFNRDADANVMLSWWAYENCKLSPKLHLDGGIDQIYEDEADYSENSPFIILYSGSYVDYAGVNMLIDLMQSNSDANIHFWLLGKGENSKIESLSKTDSRIKRFGFVPEEEMLSLCRKAHVFINPRLNGYADNLMTFPSKLLFYMSFGKPVVSTMTPGLSPEYSEFLFVPDHETVNEFWKTIHNIREFSVAKRNDLRSNMLIFLNKTKTWKAQADRFYNFVTDLPK